MLVLSRKKDEVIRINDDIKVVIVDLRGDKVRIGIEAPKEVTIHRQEVYEAIQREKEQACGSAPSAEAKSTAAPTTASPAPAATPASP